MAQVPIQNYPRSLSMQDFRSISDDYGGLVKSSKFAVRIIPFGQYVRNLSPVVEDLLYLCEVGEIPGRGFMNVDLRYYGPNFKIPFQTTYEDLNLTFLCRTASLERQFFDDWMTVINPTNTWDFNYRDDYAARIDIFQFGEISSDDYEPEAFYKITCHNAYPVLLNPQPATWADDQFQRVVVSFTYTHWTREGLDTEPGYTDSLVRGRTVTQYGPNGPDGAQ